MEFVHTVEWMKQIARQAREQGRVIGFVPTMGALHAGHLSLIEAASGRASPVIVSIFVNPKQFGPAEDYARYPRSLDADREMLTAAGVDVLFAPSPDEMYPPGFCTDVSVRGLGDRLEGRVRPGHFNGVATVVLKLFQIVSPQLAFFGRKDAQQAQLIRQMVRDLAVETEIVVCPVVREPDGLAMSSRNAYLSPRERQAATVLYRALYRVRELVSSGERHARTLIDAARAVLSAEPSVITDYLEVVDADRFEPIAEIHKTSFVVVAARIGATHLIDNLLIDVPEAPAATLSSQEARQDICCWL